MRQHNGSFAAGLSASIASCVAFCGMAIGADIPLSVLNAGPSSESLPVTGADPVAFIYSPREIVNTTIPTALPIANLGGTATLVQNAADPTGAGVRNRSRGVLAVFDVNSANPPSLVVKASPGFEPTVAASSFIFLTETAAGTISTMAQLDAFLSGATPGVDYVRVFLDNPGFTGGTGPGLNFTDADLAPTTLATGGVAFPARDFGVIDPGAPGSADGGEGSVMGFGVGLLVLSDGAGSAVPTEYFCVRTSPTLVRPVSARVDSAGIFLLVTADMPLVTDGDNSVSPSDTNPAQLPDNVLRARVDGAGPAILLSDFLMGLSVPRFVLGYGVWGERRDTLAVLLSAPLDGEDLTKMRAATVGFIPSQVSGGVHSFAGEVTFGMITSYVPVGGGECPAGANADTNGDGVINFADLNAVLSDFGVMGGAVPGDVNADGRVDFADLNAVLSAFGVSCF
ncbi:MAG: hypothetical protein KF684_11695 [Phycisphaeraceae bacterium]|nr:hypothetical protein [Phycisphaeraceae bacterium]